jgi:hypothetical protein
MDIHNEFIAQEKNLVFYAGKPIINRVHEFNDINGNPWDFSEAISYFFVISEERDGGVDLIEWTSPDNLSNSTNQIILNSTASDTDIGTGKYYYEMGYLIAGGYEVLTAYGQAKFI